MSIYEKTRDLLRYPKQDFVNFAFRALPHSLAIAPIPRDKVNELSIQLKATRAIRRFFDLIVCVLRPINIIAKDHPSRFYRGISGKAFLGLFQPILRFRVFLLEFEIFLYAGYFGKIAKSDFDLFEPHPDFIKRCHYLAPKQQGSDKGTARPQSEPLPTFNNN